MSTRRDVLLRLTEPQADALLAAVSTRSTELRALVDDRVDARRHAMELRALTAAERKIREAR